MTVISLLIVVLLTASCGGNREAPVVNPALEDSAEAAMNRPPVLESVAIAQEKPIVGETLSLSFRVVDPDRDNVRIGVEWFVNGVSYRKGENTTLSTDQLARGDRVYAVVRARDGRSEVSALSPRIEMANRPPRVTGLRLVPNAPTGADSLVVVAEATDDDGDPYEFEYSWHVNGSSALPGTVGGTLEPGHVKRGDEVRVSVVANDGFDDGPRVYSKPVRIQNSPPTITSAPTYTLAGPSRYEYQITAEDPDNDRPLRFQVVDGPPGLSVDLVGGLVTWPLSPDVNGRFPIEVSVSDPYGGQDTQRYVLELHWETEPADTP